MISRRTIIFGIIFLLILVIAVVLRVRQRALSVPQESGIDTPMTSSVPKKEKATSTPSSFSPPLPEFSDEIIEELQREQAEREEEYREAFERYQNKPPAPDMVPGSPPEGVWPE